MAATSSGSLTGLPAGAGVAEADIDRTEPLFDVGDHAVDVRLGADIASEADPADLRRDGFAAFTVPVDDRDTGAGTCERSATSGTDAAGAPRDHGDLACELHGEER
jgi:hypothetical protein